MKKYFNRICMVVAAVGLLAMAPMANAGLTSFSLLGGLNQTVNNGGGAGWLGGAQLDIWAGPTFSFEVGGEYLSRTFGDVGYGWVEIPVMVRLPIVPSLLSFGVGAFYDAPVSSNLNNNYGVVGS